MPLICTVNDLYVRLTAACINMQDAMETAAQSADPEIAEELLHFFVENNERECFAASLYTCYDLIKPDVALEVRKHAHVWHTYSIELKCFMSCAYAPLEHCQQNSERN